MRVFVIDGTEGGIYYRALVKLEGLSVDVETNLDAVSERLLQKSYDAIVISSAKGRASLLDVAEKITWSKTSRKTEIVLILDNPTMAERVKGVFRGRRFIRFKSNEIDKVCKLFEER